MSFLFASRLWLLLLPALAVVGYVLALRRKSRYALRFADVELLDEVAPDRPGWRRHLPTAALLAAAVFLVLSFARPVTAVQVPREQATVVLAVDVSLSMDADDVSPTRIDAAQTAALNFIDLAPDDLQIGIVSFAGTAFAALAPTTDRQAARAAVDRLVLGEGTAIGEAIYAGLDLVERASADAEEPVPATIVLLSDGETTVGRAEADAASAAVAAGVPVSTIAFGTQSGSIVYEGEVIPVPANEGALSNVAETTGGRFFTAASASELQSILDVQASEIGFETEEREVWEWFMVAGLVGLALAAGGSLLWFSRLP